MNNQTNINVEYKSAQDWLAKHHVGAVLTKVDKDAGIVLYQMGTKTQSVKIQTIMEANNLATLQQAERPNSRHRSPATFGTINDNSSNGNRQPHQMTREERIREGHNLTRTHGESITVMDKAIQSGMSHDDAAELTSMSFGSNGIKQDPETIHDAKIAEFMAGRD